MVHQIRRFMQADKLEGIIDLPEEFKNQRVEVVVKPTVPIDDEPKDPERIEAAIERFCHIIPDSSPYRKMTLEQIREERLSERYGIKFTD